ncbi:MAG TPA: DUF1667 domain-containing protein [Clostridia bacterium]|nr:DUF1667 domain-containing protein [Clostridia bacterium]
MKMTCINCPMGCQLEVNLNGKEVVVTGNTCARGITYGKQEFLLPMRTVTSLVKVRQGGVLSVKTNSQVPKSKIFEVLDTLKNITVDSPIKIGDVIVKNVLNLGVDIVATKNL